MTIESFDLDKAPGYVIAAFGLVLVVVPAAAALVPVIVIAMRRERSARFRSELRWYLRLAIISAVVALVLAVAAALVFITVSVWGGLEKTPDPTEQAWNNHLQHFERDDEESPNPSNCGDSETHGTSHYYPSGILTVSQPH